MHAYSHTCKEASKEMQGRNKYNIQSSAGSSQSTQDFPVPRE